VCGSRAVGLHSSSSTSLADSRLFLVQRPRVLVCGGEGCGQEHLGPALLHLLEGLPVQSIGLPSLLADAGAR
jgi:SpoVK/Ycf46/Vps4 family AAA+-type ATPase